MKSLLLWMLFAAHPRQGVLVDVDDDPSYRTVTRAAAPSPRMRSQLQLDAQTPGFATAVPLDDARNVGPMDAISQRLQQQAPVRLRSLGGLGQFSALSMRGSSAQQVGIFIEGVPLATGVSGLADLSTLALDIADAAKVYRGFIPITYGGAAMGGAVDFVGDIFKGPTRVTLRLGGGSFGGKEAGCDFQSALASGLSLRLKVLYAGSDGDFTFLDTRNTPQVTSDDQMTRRRFNDYDRVGVAARLDGRARGWRLALVQTAVRKEQHVPGPYALQDQRRYLQNTLVRSIASATFEQNSSWSVAAKSSLGYASQRFQYDVAQGRLRDQNTRMFDVYAALAGTMKPWLGQQLTLSGDGRFEQVGITHKVDPVDGAIPGDRRRFWGGVGIEAAQHLFEGALLVVPALRFDGLRNHATASRDSDAFSRAWSPRVGVRWRLARHLEARGSAGRYFRPPTLSELFGEQGYVRGDAQLRPERGLGFDVGMRATTLEAPAGAYVQLAAFASRSRDVIAWFQRGGVVRPANVRGADVYGAEFAFTLWMLRHRLECNGSYTALRSENREADARVGGRALPGHPAHQFYGTLRHQHGFFGLLGVRRIEEFAALDWTAGTFLDESGYVPVPARAFLNLGGSVLLAGSLRMALEVRNATNLQTTTWTPPIANAGRMRLPVTDFLGYPLPGRSFWMSATWTLESDS